jgi:hypothetical protein
MTVTTVSPSVSPSKLRSSPSFDISTADGLSSGSYSGSRKRSAPAVSDSDSSLTAEDGNEELPPFTYGFEDFYTHDEFSEVGQPNWDLSSSLSNPRPDSTNQAAAKEDIDFNELLDELATDSDSECFLQEHEVVRKSTPMYEYMNSWKSNPPKKQRRLAIFIRPNAR